MKEFRQIQSNDRVLNQVQTNVAEVVKPLLKNPLLSNTVLAGVTLLSGSINVVNHGLGRTYQGFVVSRPRTFAFVCEASGSNVSPSTQLLLSSSADLTCDLLVW